jgi:P2 family phage contractile tail tube protein
MIPRVIKNFNLMVDGVGFAGKVSEVTPPALVMHTDEHRAGGMDAPADIAMGMERLDLKFTMEEHSPILFRQFGLVDGLAVSAIFRAAKADDTVVEPYIIYCRGRYKDLTSSAIKVGDKSPLTATINCRYYRMMQNGVELAEIDIDNFVRRIAGVDQLTAERNAISF